jgi:hypothetical protein
MELDRLNTWPNVTVSTSHVVIARARSLRSLKGRCEFLAAFKHVWKLLAHKRNSPRPITTAIQQVIDLITKDYLGEIEPFTHGMLSCPLSEFVDGFI